jgi:S-adenosylmethionine/arginine decarboxylase-like enzyme
VTDLLLNSFLQEKTMSSKQQIRDEYKCTEIQGQKYYGKHLLLTARTCNDKVLEIDTFRTFFADLVEAIEMEAYGDLVIARFGEGIEVGISAVQLIMTSSITVHTNDAAGDMYLDVFSCKWFDEAVVKEMIEYFFDPASIQFSVILRN